MSYKFKKGYTPDHQTNVGDMDGVNNTYKPITRMKESGIDVSSSMEGPKEVKANPQNFSGVDDSGPAYQNQGGLGGTLSGTADLISGASKFAKTFKKPNSIGSSPAGNSGPVGGGPGSTGVIPKGLPAPKGYNPKG